MVFTRPSSLPCPTTYHRFTVNRNGVITRLRIQDLTDDMTETAMEMLTTYFPRDEPPCKYIEVTNHPTAMAELKKLWRDSINEKVSLVCVLDEDGPVVMVGVNVLTVVCEDDKDEPFESQDKVWSQLFGAVDTVARSVDVFKHYRVDKYLNAYGLVVASEWRGMKIGTEILRARIPLCKALGVKATVTVFTAAASQIVAKKAGFEELSSFTYEDLAKMGFVFPGVEKDTKSSKLMGMLIE